MSALTRASLLGFHAHPGTAADYIGLVSAHIARRHRLTVLYHNLHTLYGYFTSPSLKRAFDGTTIIVDGMGVLFLYKLAGFPLSRDYRLTYVDFILPMMTLARDQGWRVFHLGQRADVQARAFDVIRDHAPGIDIAGHHGFFDKAADSPENIALIDDINARGIDLLLVGLGTPAQELWVDAHRSDIGAPVVMTCGSCMEYLAGEVRTAPRWMGRAGLEWLFRLFEDPRRFAWRYLVQPFQLAAILFRHRKSSVDDDDGHGG